VSADHLNRLFKAQTGRTLSEYLNDVRIQTAKELMRDGVERITEIAFTCGFQSPSYFSTRFRAATGRSPRAYLQGIVRAR
jgi:AraC-like DNA-binding protein